MQSGGSSITYGSTESTVPTGSCVCVALVQSAPSVSVLLLPFLGYQNGTPSWESRSLQPWLGVAIGVVKG